MASPRAVVRVLVSGALCVALAACSVLPVPAHLPAVALGQPSLYRLEIALAAFYGCLLLVTPAYSGLVAGRLPIEISTRGARFAAEADQTAERDENTISELRLNISQVVDGLSEAMIEIDRLKGGVTEDDER
jgi:hypothetical protein